MEFEPKSILIIISCGLKHSEKRGNRSQVTHTDGPRINRDREKWSESSQHALWDQFSCYPELFKCKIQLFGADINRTVKRS